MNCKQCTGELINKREDALFCNANCKQKYFKRKKQILSKIVESKHSDPPNPEMSDPFSLFISNSLGGSMKIGIDGATLLDFTN